MLCQVVADLKRNVKNLYDPFVSKLQTLGHNSQMY